MTEIFECIRQIVVEQLGIDAGEVTPEADFVSDLGCDSLDCVELVMEFEERFDIVIADEDADRIRTVADAEAYLKED